LTKFIDTAEISFKIWYHVSLTAEKIEEIVPDFHNYATEKEFKELKKVIEEHLSLNYLDHIQDAESEVDQCKVKFEFGSEED
jgi:hypothetical protein